LFWRVSLLDFGCYSQFSRFLLGSTGWRWFGSASCSFCWCPPPCPGGCLCTTELCMGVFCGTWCYEFFCWGPCCNMASNILLSLVVSLSFIWKPNTALALAPLLIPRSLFWFWCPDSWVCTKEDASHTPLHFSSSTVVSKSDIIFMLFNPYARYQ